MAENFNYKLKIENIKNIKNNKKANYCHKLQFFI